MDDAVQIRLKLIYESVQSCISVAQCTLSKSTVSDATIIEELELINIKLKSANQRLVSEIYNYCKLIKEPNAEQIREYTSAQLQAENLLAEIDFRIVQTNRNRMKVSHDSLSSKLPRMELAKFDGDVLKWYQFWDQISSNVDCRNISDVDKLLYLQSVLEGNAKQAIEGLDTTNKNYHIAVDTLKERYGKPSSIIDAHYVALYRIKATPSNQINQCRQVLNEIERHLRVLSSLGEDVNHNHLRVMIIEKFPEDIIYELRMKMTGKEETIENIRKTLEYIVSARESSSRLRNETLYMENDDNRPNNVTIGALHIKSDERGDNLQKITTTDKIKPKLIKKQFKRQNYSTLFRKRPYDNINRCDEPPKKKINKCTFCNQDHFNDECHTYPTIQERKTKLGNRCYNCLNSGHRANKCRAKRKCRHCNKFGVHNRALCPVKSSQLESPVITNNLHIGSYTNTTLLQTCLVDVSNLKTDTWRDNACTLRCRVLLDCGSQRSYVTESIAKSLALPVLEKINLSIFTFGTLSPRELESPIVKFKLTTRTGATRVLYANVVPHITNGILPPIFNNSETIRKDVRLQGLIFADDGSYGDRIDILIGNDYYNSFMYQGKIMVTDDLFLVNSDFGWVWSGKVGRNKECSDQLSVLTYYQSSPVLENNGPNQDNILHLRFCRVPFGVISSPFLLNATIRFHLLKTKSSRMSQIAEDIYVDNIVTGAQTTTEAFKLYNECKQTFESLSMNLREWSSNSEQLNNSIPTVSRTCDNKPVKILGIMWDFEQDKLSLKVTVSDINKTETKRSILKCIASIYDPCGFAVPVILPAKLFFQRLWKEKIKWDVKLNNELLSEWNKIKSKFTYLENININRYYAHGLDTDRPINSIDYELHCFTDSSMEAYAAVIYLRCSLGTNNIVNFVIGKSRLVPLKNKDNLQIPKLELLGVLIGSRLLTYVTKSIKIHIKNHFLWTDSQVVLSWCESERLLPPFVSRRVKEIKENKLLHLRYVPTKLNPADMATRPEHVDLYDQWIKGPQFLELEHEQWPKSHKHSAIAEVQSFLAEECPSNTELIEGIKETYSNNTNNENSQIIEIQLKYFPREVEGAETNLSRSLKIYKDEDGIIRCKGRFRFTDMTHDQKEPVLLPKDAEFTQKLIKNLHEENFHVGVSHTLALLRKKFWVPQGRSTVQKVIRKCAQCVKYGGGPFKLPDMPDLPKERVRLFLPFAVTGLDYFGPLYVKSTPNEKRWVCLFTCLAIRAIHLEVVNDLSAEECLLAIRRFIATRGLPCLIISDNATQFKLTAEVIISGYCIKNNVCWKFIPELAPWFGGFYERLIGLVKNSLKRTLEKHIVNQDQLYTIMKEIEAVINTRPLTAVGSEIEHVLTPADFLRVGGALTTYISDQDFVESATVTKTNLIDGWKRGQIILQEFTKMFKNQYLTSLRERNDKQRQPRVIINRAPRLDEVVQIRENGSRVHWRVGKIIEMSKGLDGQIRVAKVKVPSGEIYTRSISHLYPLEISDQHTASSEDIHNITPSQKAIQDISNEPAETSTSRTTENLEPVHKQLTRSSAVKARELVKQWTSQLLTIT